MSVKYESLPLMVFKLWPMLKFCSCNRRGHHNRALTFAPRTYLSRLAKNETINLVISFYLTDEKA